MPLHLAMERGIFHLQIIYMEKVLIIIKNGAIVNVHSTTPIMWTAVDYDMIDNGDNPINGPFENDNAFASGSAYEHFTDASDPIEMEIRDELKKIKF